jgi:hypothetical protein
MLFGALNTDFGINQYLIIARSAHTHLVVFVSITGEEDSAFICKFNYSYNTNFTNSCMDNKNVCLI